MSEAAAASPTRKLKAFVSLCRVSNLPTVWMNVTTAVVLSRAEGSITAGLLLAGSLSALYCAGMCLNDLFDRGIDARERPERPISSGRVTPAQAATLAAWLIVGALGLLLLTPRPSAVIPGVVLVAMILAYDWFHKEHPSTVLLMAGCRLMVFVVSGWALSATIPPLVALAGFLHFGYTLLVTAVARYENQRAERFALAVIPNMIAGMALLDGIVLSLASAPAWIGVGLGAAVLTRASQRYVRGD